MRPVTALLALILSFSVATPAATAKGVASATACGASGCKELGKSQAHHRLMEGGEPALAPERAAPYFSVRMRVGADGHYERVRAYYVPSARLVGFDIADHPTQWSHPSSASAAAYRDATRGLKPFPAPGLERFVAAPLPPNSGVVGVYTGADEPASGGGFPWLASGIGLAGALAAGGLALARRRRTAGARVARGRRPAAQ